MKPRSFSSLFLLAGSLWSLATPGLMADPSPYRGLWVGEAVLGQVNEVTVPLDAANVPRAPDPKVTTPTFDAASLRLIVHVDATGKARLLKQVAVLARKPELQKTEADMALVTDERLYGAFPPQAATRLSSVMFDFGDAKATAAVDQIAERAAAAAATAAAASNATQTTVKNAAANAANGVIAEANAVTRFNNFLQANLDATKVRAIANGASTASARTAANALLSGSFYADRRGIEMIDAIEAALAAAPPTATAQQREQIALNTAAAFAETDRAYDRFLAGELIGDTIDEAANTAASSAASIALKPISAFQTFSSGTATAVVSAGHALATGDEIAIRGAGIGAYNGLHKITRIDANTFRLDLPFVAGKAVTDYAGYAQVAPMRVLSANHGLQSGDRIIIRDSLSSYNGSTLVTVVDANTFTVPVAFQSDPPLRGVWASHYGDITSFEGVSGASSVTKITSPGHGLANGQVIEIHSSSNSSYNGQKAITRIDANSFTIPMAFAGNPTVKGSWDLPHAISSFEPPSIQPTRVTSASHGLTTGDRIVISGSGKSEYNAEFTVTVVSSNEFTIPFDFDASSGNPATKGNWAPAPGGQFRKTAAIRAAIETGAKVTAARIAALNAKLTTYSDTRAPDALQAVLDAIVAQAATSESPLLTEVAQQADTAGREALGGTVVRYPQPSTIPSTDYSAFVTSATFTGSISTAADAAAAAALKEKTNLLATPASIQDKARAAAINVLTSVYSAAARSLLTEISMTGDFGSSVSTEIFLPANHPTNPFRHRRHPDHTIGFDIRRQINLSFQPVNGMAITRSSFGVESISGIYSEEIFGLHKPLGPSRDTGLKVRGTFQLNRISLIDTLNSR